MCCWNGKEPKLTHPQRVDTRDTVDLRTIAAAGIDMGDPAFTTGLFRIKISIQYAGPAGKLQLPCRWLNHISLRVAKQPFQLTSGFTHDRFQSLHVAQR